MKVRLISAAAVALVAVGVVVADVRAPEEQTAQPAREVVPVQAATLLCPLVLGGSDITSSVAAGVAPGQPGGDRPGAGALQVLSPDPAALAVPIQEAGRPVILDTGRQPAVAGTSVTATASGGLAPGLGADQVSASADWFARTSCTPGVTDAWLVGGGSRPGRTSLVVLTNAQDAAAQVDLLVYGPAGPAAAPGGRGLVVPARGRLTVALQTIAPGLQQAAVHAVVRVGRVGVAMLDHEVDGLLERGVDWVAPAASPARTVTIPGIPDGVAAELTVLTPGGTDASVRLQVVTSEGALVPVDLGRFDAPAGRVTGFNVSAALEGASGGLVLTSDQPVVAAVRYRVGRAFGRSDVAVASAADPIGAQSGPAVVTALEADASVAHRLMITTGETPVTLRLQAFSRAAAPPAPVGIEVPPRRTVVVGLAAPAGVERFATSVDVVAGEAWLALVSVRRTESGTQVTGGPLLASRVTVAVPPVVPDLAIALPTASAR